MTAFLYVTIWLALVPIVAYWRAFVAVVLWGWFVAPAFGIAAPSIHHAFGIMQMCDGTNWPDIAQKGDGFQAYQEACDIIETIADEINTAIRALPLPSDDGEVR